MIQPYRDSAHLYLRSGLGYPIPSVWPFEKKPPVAGWTGRSGAIPDKAQVEKWCRTHPDSNILIRVAPNVIGIDVDDYDDKTGAASLLALERIHGHLPPTAISTARELPSGIHWYQLRRWMDTDKMRDPATHVEVIRFGHRYATAPPSWHQDAHSRYRWATEVPPTIRDIGFLPTEWYIHLTRGCSCFEVERAERRRTMRRVMNRPAGVAGREAARADLEQASEALKAMSEGSRNNMLSSIAGRFFLYDVVLNGTLDDQEVAGELTRAGLRAGLELQEIERTIRSALEWAIREGEKE